MCVHRIDQGMDPFCVICCEGQAMIFGDLNEHESKVAKRITVNDVFQLQPELETNPSIYYIPPRAKRKL